MPAPFSEKSRQEAVERILDGLANGVTLTVICAPQGMPAWRTVYDWMDADPELSAAIACARDAGWDKIATDALRIADTPQEGVREKVGKDGLEIVKEDMLGHRKLQVETRLKLLAKWDPKRYGEMVKHANADGSNIALADIVSQARDRVKNADQS